MKRHPVFLTVLLLSGCSALSGLDSQSKFSCKAPDGISCSSLSGVYANAVEDNLPGLRQPAVKAQAEKPRIDETLPAAFSITRASPSIVGQTPVSGEPIHTRPKILRIWLAPWEDADGDLHDQSYLYMVADYGRWMVEHNRQRIIDWYRPTTLKTGEIGMDASHQDKKTGWPGGHFTAPAAPPQNQYPDTLPREDMYDLEDPF